MEARILGEQHRENMHNSTQKGAEATRCEAAALTNTRIAFDDAALCVPAAILVHVMEGFGSP